MEEGDLYAILVHFPQPKAPAPLRGRGSVLLREFFFYFFERHFERMPA